MSVKLLLEVWLSFMMPANANLAENQIKAYRNPSTATLILSGTSSFVIGFITQAIASQTSPSSKLAPYFYGGAGILVDNYVIQRNLATYTASQHPTNTIQLVDTAKKQFANANYEQNYYGPNIPNTKQTYTSPLHATISRSCFALGVLIGIALKEKMEEKKNA